MRQNTKLRKLNIKVVICTADVPLKNDSVTKGN